MISMLQCTYDYKPVNVTNLNDEKDVKKKKILLIQEDCRYETKELCKNLQKYYDSKNRNVYIFDKYKHKEKFEFNEVDVLILFLPIDSENSEKYFKNNKKLLNTFIKSNSEKLIILPEQINYTRDMLTLFSCSQTLCFSATLDFDLQCYKTAGYFYDSLIEYFNKYFNIDTKPKLTRQASFFNKLGFKEYRNHNIINNKNTVKELITKSGLIKNGMCRNLIDLFYSDESKVTFINFNEQRSKYEATEIVDWIDLKSICSKETLMPLFTMSEFESFLSHRIENNNDETFYEGLFSNGKKHGYGTLYNSKTRQVMYEGVWENDRKHGRGREYYEDGTIYEGNFSYDAKHGDGILYNKSIEPTKIIYRGYWLNNKKHGDGTQFYDDGTLYIGDFMDGKKCGKGVLYFKSIDSNNTAYKGYWENDQKHNEGIEYYKDGSKYVGNWKNGKKDGYGSYYKNDGSIYIGSWINDEKCGHGKIYYASGERFEGIFNPLNKEAVGRLYYDCDRKYEDNKIIKETNVPVIKINFNKNNDDYCNQNESPIFYYETMYMCKLFI